MYLEASQCLSGAIVGVDHTNTTLTARAEVIEPHCVIDVVRCDLDGQGGDRSAVIRGAETRVETVDANIRHVSRDARGPERSLDRRVVSRCD